MGWLPSTPDIEAVLDRLAATDPARRRGRIHDVRIKTLVKHTDERGYFIEQLKRGDLDDEGRQFIERSEFAQMSHSVVYARGGNPPEPIKAFHWHRRQWDYWDIVVGNARVVLVDLRADSPTCGVIQTLLLGDNSPRVVAIPPLVAHGYQCLGTENLHLVYYVTEPYNPGQPDEGRIAWNDSRIGFDWQIDNI